MNKFQIVVDPMEDWAPFYPTKSVMGVEEFLRYTDMNQKGRMVINLCRDMSYLSPGYYCSLLAGARGAKVMPSVSAINDLANFSHYSLLRIDHSRLKPPPPLPDGVVDTVREAHFFFGQSDDPALQPLARALFERYMAPILTLRLRAAARWMVEGIALGTLHTLTDAEQTRFAESLEQFCSKVWPRPRKGKTYRYDLAILHNPDAPLPPSNEKALRLFTRAGQECGLDVELITPDDYGRLAEFDALFIRETTAVNHHTYRFAKRAEHEGLVVIDAPSAILRCTNKVFLKELLDAARIPTPRTLMIMRRDRMTSSDLLREIGAPLILKVPDGSFSIGVEKVDDEASLDEALARLFQRSAILLAQEYAPTPFDWRIGILDGRPIYACKYFMARGHWQIYNHASQRDPLGNAEAIGVQHVPRPVIQSAVRACRLIGDGLFGVDIKEWNGRAVVIEVNDNPSIDAGVEDAYLGEELYRIIMGDFLRRIDEARR